MTKYFFGFFLFVLILFWNLFFKNFKLVSYLKKHLHNFSLNPNSLNKVQKFLHKISFFLNLKNACYLVSSTLFLLSSKKSKLCIGRITASNDYHCWLVSDHLTYNTCPSANYTLLFEITK